MRVKIESIGGFTGREVMVAEYETDDLPERECARVLDAVEKLDAARAAGGTGEVGADLPGYRVTVGDGSPRIFEVYGDPSEELSGPLAVLLQGPIEPG